MLPQAGPGQGSEYAKALQPGGPADLFASARQAAYFLHLFFVLPAVAAVAICSVARATCASARRLHGASSNLRAQLRPPAGWPAAA